MSAPNSEPGAISTSEAPLVSADFNHNPASSTFDLTQTQAIEGRFVRVLSRYDNEWGLLQPHERYGGEDGGAGVGKAPRFRAPPAVAVDAL